MGLNLLVEWSQRDLRDLVLEALSEDCTPSLVAYIQERGRLEGVRAILIDRRIVYFDRLGESRQDPIAAQGSMLVGDALRLRHSRDREFVQSIIGQAIELCGFDSVLLDRWYEEYCRKLVEETSSQLEAVRVQLGNGDRVHQGEIEKVLDDLAQIIYFTESWVGTAPSRSFLKRLIRDAVTIELCGCPGAFRNQLHEYNIRCGNLVADALEFD